MSANLNKDLVKAASSGRLGVVKRLLDKGADPRLNYSRPLWAAAANGHLKTVKLLLPMSDPKAGDSWALSGAAMNGHIEIVKALLPVSDPKANKSWALSSAAMNGHLEVVKLLLPVSDPKVNNFLALRVAAVQGHLEIVRLLLPSSDIDQAMLDAAFIETNGCDFLLSCLPAPKARKLLAANPGSSSRAPAPCWAPLACNNDQ